MTLPLNIYKNHERLLLGTRALPIASADTFKLYWSPVVAGPFSFIKSFPNVPDKTLYPGNALVAVTRTGLGVLLTDAFFLKITSVKGGSESAIADSDLTTIPPEGAETNDEMREELTNVSQLFGYNSVTGLWQRVTTDGAGKLETVATLVVDQLPLPILDILSDSQQTVVPLTTFAVDVLQAPQIPAPLADRKIVVLQNNDVRDILTGDSILQSHVVPRRGGVRSFSGGPSLSLYAKVAAGAAALSVWEFA